MTYISRKKARLLASEYMAIAQPDKMATTPHPRTLRPWLSKDKPDPPTPDSTRTAYYWMAMGISQLLKK